MSTWYITDIPYIKMVLIILLGFILLKFIFWISNLIWNAVTYILWLAIVGAVIAGMIFSIQLYFQSYIGDLSQLWKMIRSTFESGQVQTVAR